MRFAGCLAILCACVTALACAAMFSAAATARTQLEWHSRTALVILQLRIAALQQEEAEEAPSAPTWQQ